MVLARDFRYAIRVLARSPGFSITAVLVLSLAMGANTAIFSVIEAVLLRPLPYHDPQRLCMLWKTVPARNIEWDWTSYPTIRDWHEQNHVFADLSVILRPENSKVTLPQEAGPERIQGSKVSANLFQIMGVQPLLGRTFSADEELRGDDVVVLSYGFWQRRFGGDKTVLGRTLQFNGRNTMII